MAAPFIAGRQPVAEYIANTPARVHRVFLASGRANADIVAACQAAGIPFQFVSKRQLLQRYGESGKRGVVAEVAGMDILQETELLDQYAACALDRAVLFDRLTDVGNAGAIVRSGIAFGFTHFVFASHRNVGIPAVAGTSAGYAALARFYRVTSPAGFCRKAQHQGVALLCLDAAGQDIRQAPLQPPFLLVVGGEEKGIRRTILNQADQVLAIPTQQVESLNAGVSAAIAMYEMHQRGI